MTDWFDQRPFAARLDWGPAGAQQLAVDDGCLVVVDVLSFTTSVSVAVEAGTAVYPYRWRDESAAGFAGERDATLAVGRRQISQESPYSLSPAALRSAPFTPRLVLPSPNGSAIAAAAAGRTSTRIAAASLRNASATAEWLVHNGFGTPDRPVVVIPAGEPWPDQRLRPALEDLLGAGAVIAALHERGVDSQSPEAAAARACFHGTDDVGAAVRDCGSGRELTGQGFGDDVEIAVEIDACEDAAVLNGGAFVRPEL